MTHVTCRLTAKNRDQLRNPTLGNRLCATYTFLQLLDGLLSHLKINRTKLFTAIDSGAWATNSASTPDCFWGHLRTLLTSYRLGGGEKICPPLTAVWLAADIRPSADGSAVRTSLVAGQLQRANSLGCDRQTDGRIAVSFNAPTRRRHGVCVMYNEFQSR